MGRFGVNEADNYGGNGQSSFFSLSNDGEVARIRIMYNGIDDVSGYAVHEISVTGNDGNERRRVVNCLRSYNEPKSACPFCNSGRVQKAKLYVPIYDIDADEVKLWERGKTFFPKISSLCARYSSSNTPLVSHIFEVERHGKKGDTSTVYEFYETGSDETKLEDLPEIPEVIGTIIMDKSAEDMEYFIENGSFKDSGSNNTKRSENNERSNMPTGRRTPSSGRRGDTF